MIIPKPKMCRGVFFVFEGTMLDYRRISPIITDVFRVFPHSLHKTAETH